MLFVLYILKTFKALRALYLPLNRFQHLLTSRAYPYLIMATTLKMQIGKFEENDLKLTKLQGAPCRDQYSSTPSDEREQTSTAMRLCPPISFAALVSFAVPRMT